MKYNAFKCTVFFPLLDNEGNEFPEEVWAWWTDQGIVSGWWEGYDDFSRWITAVVKTQADIGAFRAFLIAACPRFRQECLYLDYHEVRHEEVA